MSELDTTATLDMFVEFLAAWQEALASAIAAIQQAWDAICAIVASAVHAINRIWRQWCAAHIIPRTWRDTMMRRKIRRYALHVAGHHV